MPLLKGESLEARLRRNPPLSLAEAVRIGKEIAVGLAAAHAQGLIHRDIKPANVWLESRQGDRETRRQGDQKARAVSPCLPVSLSPGLPSKFRVKILDFGLARAAGDKGNVTHSGAIMGTPAYMAPEQASGRAVDARTDLFSLGCVLYRLCTGTMPFHGPDAISTLMAVTHHQPPPPSELNRALPRSLSDLIMALLAKDPQARPQSADDVAAALGDMERHVPAGGEYVPEVPVQAPGTHADTQSSVRADTAALRAPLPVKRGLSRRWLTVAAILVTLIGLSIILVPLLTRSSNGDAVMRSSTPDSNVSSRDSSSASSIPSSPGKSASSSEMRSSSEPPAADDRTVALWCVEHGCSIIMGNDKDNFVPCDKSDDLRPLDASFHIVALVTHAPFKVDDKNLEQFAGLSRLEQLMLNTQPITDTGIANLRGCRRLGTLGIFSCKVSDDCFRLIAEQFPELSFLEVSNSEVTGAGLAHLKKMKKLKQLHLGFIPSLKEAELVHLQGLETLEHLGLNQIALTNAGLALLKDLPGLKRLDIQMTQIKDDGLEPLLHLPQLEELVVAYTLVTNDGLKTLVRIPGLTNLSLAGTRVDNDGLAALRDLKNLKTLYLLDLRIKDTGVASIRDLPGLAHLYLSGTDVTDDCLPHLQGMKSLKSVVLTRTKITPAGAKRIKEALAPQVEVFADGLP
jgi:serine/threonine protein kinase